MTTLNARLTSFTKLGSIWRKRSNSFKTGKTNGADIGLGLLVTKDSETAPDVDLCPYNEVYNGVASGRVNGATDMKADDAQGLIPDDINIKFCEIADDDEVILCLGASRGATLNHIAAIDIDNPGYVMSIDPADESIAQIPPFRMLGLFMADYSAVSEVAQYCWVLGK